MAACRRAASVSHTNERGALRGWSRCLSRVAAARAAAPQQQRRAFGTAVKPAGFIDIQKYLTDFEGTARKKGPMPQGKRGPRPKAYMEYGASTVIRGTVARKAPGGNIRKYKVTSIVGNGKGWAGIGSAQSVDSGRVARTKSLADSMKNMFYIERYRGKTVYHQVTTKLGATWVELWPRRSGTGVKAGKIPSMLMQRLGITDVGIKIRGSRNKTMQLKATIKALSMIESHEHAAKRRGVMLPRLNYHDYRRVCDERSEAVAQSLLFAEEEPGASMPGMKAARPRPSLPMMGIDAVRTDPSLHAKFNAAKVAASERKRAHRLARLKDVRDRSDSLIYDRINEEIEDLQRELAAEAAANEAKRQAELLALEQEWEEMRRTLTQLEPEFLEQAAPVVKNAQKLERRAEAADAVFEMYKKRVVDLPAARAEQAAAVEAAPASTDEPGPNDGNTTAPGFRKV